jgi:hypothetical protein
MGKITMYYMKWEFGTTLCPNYNIIIVGIWNYLGKKNFISCPTLSMKSCKMKDKQSDLFESQTTMYEWIPKFILHMNFFFNYLKTRKSMKHQEIQKILPSICQFTNSVIHQIFTIGFN